MVATATSATTTETEYMQSTASSATKTETEYVQETATSSTTTETEYCHTANYKNIINIDKPMTKKTTGVMLNQEASAKLLAGGLAGCVAKTATAPLARLTILFQIKGAVTGSNTCTLRHETWRILTEEGPRAFWKGNGVTVIHRLPYSAISFFAFEKYKTFLQPMKQISSPHSRQTNSFLTSLLAGGAAGMTALASTYPLDLVRTRLAAQTTQKYYHGICHTLTTVVREEGLRGLYKGMGASLLSVGPCIAINFSVYESLKENYMCSRKQMIAIDINSAMANSNNHQLPWYCSLAFGCISGVASSTLTFPVDVVRRRIQVSSSPALCNSVIHHSHHLNQKMGVFKTLFHIAKTEGFIRGLYKGILPEYLKVIPSLGITFATYEYLKKHFIQTN